MMINKHAIGLLVMIMMIAAGTSAADDGYLYIESDPGGARVVINGFYGRALETPTLCTLEVGRYDVTLFQDNYEPRTIEVTIKPDWVERRNVLFVDPSRPHPDIDPPVTLAKHLGQLTILTDVPGGSVWLDDQLMPVTAPVTIKEVSAGEHRVMLEIRGLTYDTTVTIPIEQTLVLDLPMAELVARAGLTAAGSAVPVSIVIELPGCRYLRADERTDLRSNITIIGVDTKLRLLVGDSTVELSHHNLATRDIGMDSRGQVVKKRAPDTTITYNLQIAANDSLQVAVLTYTWDGQRYISRDRIRPRRKSTSIPAGFNNGQIINLRVVIDAHGDIAFKYW